MSDQHVPKQAGVVGLGAMGADIAYILAARGIPVVGVDVNDDALDRAGTQIDSLCDDAVKREKLTAELSADARGRVTLTTQFEALTDCDFVIEAVPEEPDVKSAVLASIDQFVSSSAIIATNTSTFSITGMSRLVSSPERFLGVHFFKPVVAMRLVEVVAAPGTAKEILDNVVSLVEALGKDVVQVEDRPGFIVNSVLVPYLNQAIEELDSHLADPETIDTAVHLGLGYRIGPYELLDLIGLDTQLAIAESIFDQTHRPEYAAPPLLKRLVEQGRLGNKTNRGIRVGEE